MEPEMEIKHKIIVAGIGPGHEDYMAPAARRAVSSAKALVGGKRALSQFASEGQKTMAVTRDIPAVMEFIREALGLSDVVVMVSGDPGYYSMLDVLRREFPEDILRVIPGISSLQAAFSRLALPWHGARLLSFHGRRPASEELSYWKGGLVGMLTDGIHHSRKIAELFLEQGWPEQAKLFVCQRISYEDERILSMTLAEAADGEEIGNCVLILQDEERGKGRDHASSGN